MNDNEILIKMAQNIALLHVKLNLIGIMPTAEIDRLLANIRVDLKI